MQILAYRYFIRHLPLLLLFLSAACSTPAGEKSPQIQANSTATVPTTHKNDHAITLTEFETKICQEFDQKLASAISLHLTAQIKDKNSFQKKGLAKWIAFFQQQYKQSFDQIQNMPAENFCDLLSMVNRATFAELKQKLATQNIPYSYGDHAYMSMLTLFDFSLTSMDYFSRVTPYSSQELPFEKTLRSSPITLLDRVDYNWRKPRKLVVDPSYQDTLHDSIPPWSLITEIENFSFQNHTFYETENFFHIGAPSETLGLTILPPGQQAQNIEIQTFESQQEDISSVKSHYRDQNEILYVRISEVSEKSKDLIVSKLAPLYKSNTIKGLIIDFTGNGGGSVEYAEKIASLLLPVHSPLFRVEQNQLSDGKKKRVSQLHTHQFPSLENIKPENLPPTIVLVSRATASSGEIITAAWKANKLPVITVGENTFGKAIGVSKFRDGFWGVTSQAVFTFNKRDDGKVDWSTWQLDTKTGSGGLVPDIFVQEPVIEYLYKNKNRRIPDASIPFTMLDLKQQNPSIPVIEFSKPQTQWDQPIDILFPEAYRLQKQELQALQTYAQTQMNIASCHHDAIPGNPAFSEAHECLYDAGLDLMRTWIYYRDEVSENTP